MHALQRVSICIFNSISKLAHRRRNTDTEPYQIPYSSRKKHNLMSTVKESQDELTDDFSRVDNNISSPFPTVDVSSSSLSTTSSSKSKSSTQNKKMIEVKNSFQELMLDDAKMKAFIIMFEEILLKLLKPTEEGIPIPLPVPYPHYLKKPPEITISETYTTVIRRLYNDAISKYSVPDIKERVLKKFPKKPRVPSYVQSEIIEDKQKSMRISSSQDNKSKRSIIFSNPFITDRTNKKSSITFCPYSCPLCCEFVKQM